MTVSPTANGASTAFPSCHENLRAAVQLAGTKAGLNGRTLDMRHDAAESRSAPACGAERRIAV